MQPIIMPIRAVETAPPDAAAKIAILIALGMGDLLPHIAAGAERIGHMAVLRGNDDHTADYWFRIHEAADLALMQAEAAADAARRIAIGGGGYADVRLEKLRAELAALKEPSDAP